MLRVAIVPFRYLLPVLLLTAATAWAEDQPASPSLFAAADWQVAAGPGLLVGPRYPGAAGYRALPIPALEARNGAVFFSGRDGLGVNVVDAGGFRAGTSVFARFGRKASDDPVRLAGLPDIAAAPQVRLFAEQAWDRFRVRTVATRDLGGGNGATLDLDASVSARLNDFIRVSAGPQASFGDGRFNRTYFGVAAAPARPAYTVGAGLYQAGVGASLFARLGGRWSMAAVASVNWLQGAPALSPVVGARTQITGGVFLSYAFTDPGRGRPRFNR